MHLGRFKFYLLIFMAVAVLDGLLLYRSFTASFETPEDDRTVFYGTPSGGVLGERARLVQSPILRPTFSVYVKDKRSVVVFWSNISPETTTINIYRAQKSTHEWIHWKTISVNPGATYGFAELGLGANENALNYEYYATGVSTNGTITWTSTATTASTSTPPLPGSSPPPGVPGTPPPAVTNPPPPAPPPAPGSTGATTTAPSYPSGTVIYYTPSGQVSGTVLPSNDPFWVQHVHQSIEIGWQNLPAATDVIIVYRSSDSSGPWTQLLQQNNPALSGLVRLLDSTLQEPFYYMMEVRSNFQIITTYGPLFLPAFQ